MSAKLHVITFRVTTAILTLIVLMFVANSIFNQMFADRFSRLGYPGYLIYPLAFANILGLTAIWSNLSRALSEWAYAGLCFNFVLAFLAELHAQDGDDISSPLALLCVAISYYLLPNVKPLS